MTPNPEFWLSGNALIGLAVFAFTGLLAVISIRKG